MNVDLACLGHIASIVSDIIELVGASVGIFGYLTYRRCWKRKKKTLVEYLKNRKLGQAMEIRVSVQPHT